MKTLALSSAIPHAGDWLNVIPSLALGLHLYDQEFCQCLQYWLGVRMFSVDYPCSFCKSSCDPYGDHQIECGSNKERIDRHDSIRNTLCSSAQAAALCPRKEIPSLIPGSKSRPADIYLPYWKHGKPAALDVSVISPLQKLTLESSSMSQGHALSVGAEHKRSVHSDACREVGVSFAPLLVETIDCWSEKASHTITSIGCLLGQHLGSNARRHHTPPLPTSIYLSMKGNSAMWLARSPTPSLSVDGII